MIDNIVIILSWLLPSYSAEANMIISEAGDEHSSLTPL